MLTCGDLGGGVACPLMCSAKCERRLAVLSMHHISHCTGLLKEWGAEEACHPMRLAVVLADKLCHVHAVDHHGKDWLSWAAEVEP